MLVPAAGVLVKVRTAGGATTDRAQGSNDGPQRRRPWEAEAPRPEQQERSGNRRDPEVITPSEGSQAEKDKRRAAPLPRGTHL